MEYAARSDAKVLITGESGVGKDLVAGLIHDRSNRRGASMVTINCAGLPDTLLESELFGHVRGSFTGAYRDKPGLLEAARGGTLFMDEIGEMSLRMQAVMLRFLETGEIQRVGAEHPGPRVDVRLIAATNRNLLDQVAAKTFREDLFYRLNVIHLGIPPLRDRREDIPELVDVFVRHYSELYTVSMPPISSETMARLLTHGWPGNVRELRNLVERAIVRAQGSTVPIPSLPLEIAAPVPPSSSDAGAPALARADQLFQRMLQGGESFWSVVYEPFMSRDLTREDVRLLIGMGLEQTRGSYKILMPLFNMPLSDYKRFLNFVRKYHCHLPFQQFRTVGMSAPARAAGDTTSQRRAKAGTGVA